MGGPKRRSGSHHRRDPLGRETFPAYTRPWDRSVQSASHDRV